METDYATQTIVDEVISLDQRFIEREALPIAEEYPEGAKAFFDLQLQGLSYAGSHILAPLNADAQQTWEEITNGLDVQVVFRQGSSVLLAFLGSVDIVPHLAELFPIFF